MACLVHIMVILTLFEACNSRPIQIAVNVNIPESSENIETLQNATVTMNDMMLISQDKILDLLDQRIGNLEKSMESKLQNIDQKIENVTAKMTELFSNTANLLQCQDVLCRENQSKLDEITTMLMELLTTEAATIKPSTEIQLNEITMQNINLSPATDCQDISVKGHKGRAPYVINPLDGLGSFEVYCDITDNEGWTVFQNRFNGSVDFYCNWTQYEEGFGDASGEYWLGLKNIRRLTSVGTWALQIDLESFDGETAYAVYDSFEISDAASNYRLSVGEYSGNAGDSLQYTGDNKHNGMAFSTYDRDNDRSSSSNCASYWKAAWWYNACHTAHLNGQYLGPDGNDYSGMIWYSWKDWQSLKSSQMKIRRAP